MVAPLPVDLKLVDPVEAWKPWQPAKNEWSRKWIAHLFRRAAFGAKSEEIERAFAEGFPKTLERLLVGTSDPDMFLEYFDKAASHCRNSGELRECWLALMMRTEHPLREKMTLFWHNHFATSIAQVRNWEAMLEQNILLRDHALGKFRPFLLEMSKNPAMLRWLDSNQNVKEAPNENYARELMELFSLGVGNYTEKDIREAARAFTGWHTDSIYPHESFEFNSACHDDGPKKVFGRTGNWDGEDIVRFCCDRPSCAAFLVGKLYSFLVSETPPPKGLLAPLEERFRKSDYDIADLVKTILGSRLFFSQHAYCKRVKWPVEYVLEAIRSLIPDGIPVTKFVDELAQMGQLLFAPPNVKGWRTGTDWLNSATLLARNNFAETVALMDWYKLGKSDEPIIHLPTPTMESTIPSFSVVLGAALPTAVPPPETAAKAAVDPISMLHSSKPKNVHEVVQWMSELLFGERVSNAYASRIEKFFHEPPTEVRPPSNPQPSPQWIPASPSPVLSPAPDLQFPPIPLAQDDKLSLAPPPREAKSKANRALAFDLNSPDFVARCREVLHAMMCLPEYQLN